MLSTVTINVILFSGALFILPILAGLGLFFLIKFIVQ